MSELEWTYEDLAVSKAESKVLEYAIHSHLANEDREPAFFVGESEVETRLSRPALIGALRSLTGRGWLTEKEEHSELARLEGRGARTYYVLSQAGLQACAGLLGAKEFLPGAEPNRSQRGRR